MRERPPSTDRFASLEGDTDIAPGLSLLVCVAPAALVHSLTAQRPVSELEAENMPLRRELANAKLDLDIVKKAATYFVRESR